MARLFFAVWPGAGAREALSRLAGDMASACGGRAVPAEKIHLTLVFLGEVPADRLDAVLGSARLRAREFALELDRAGSFRKARVAWAGASSAPRPLLALQEALAGRLAAAGFALEEREYTPHVTLVRKIERPLPPAAIDAIAWEAREFTLVRSETGTGRYAVMERWGLGE